MLNIGYHESISGGWANLVDVAIKAGGNTFAFFTRNPRAAFNDSNKSPNSSVITSLNNLSEALYKNKFASIVAHAPYTANPCSEDETKRLGAWRLITSDVEFMTKYLPGNFYNFHPGSPKSLGSAEGVKQTAKMIANILFNTNATENYFNARGENNEGINERQNNINGDKSNAGLLINNAGGQNIRCTILIETMAGKGSEIGRSFEELHDIIESTCDAYGEILQNNNRNNRNNRDIDDIKSFVNRTVGVCFDTCHVWDSGYDIKNKLDETLTMFDNILGLNCIRAIHLNDSKNPCGSRKDRHELIGQGFIGFDSLVSVITHPKFKNLPIILETPNNESGWKAEIAMLRAAYNNICNI